MNNIDQGSNSIDIYKIIYLYKKNNNLDYKIYKKKLNFYNNYIIKTLPKF